MKHLHILLFCIATLSSTGLRAMRLTNALVRSSKSTPALTSHRNSGVMCAMLYSTKKNNAVFEHHDAQKDADQADYTKKLKKTPSDIDLLIALEKVDVPTRQALLTSLIQDRAVNPKALVSLLLAGAKINMRDSKGQTPLHLLAKATNDETNYPDESYLNEVLGHIAKFNPDFSIRDQDEKDPSHYAPQRFKHLFKIHKPLDENKLRYMYPHIWG